jgi:hypothetical protein
MGTKQNIYIIALIAIFVLAFTACLPPPGDTFDPPPPPPPEPDPDPVYDSVFMADNGRVVIYIERSLPNGWAVMTDRDDFTGSNYYRWNGDESRSAAGPVQLRYHFTVDQTGNYLVRLRMLAASSEENDVWARVDGGPWHKVNTHRRNEWTFDTVIETSPGVNSQWIEKWDAGTTHTIELTANEKVSLDQIRIWLQGTDGLHDATIAESVVSGQQPPPPPSEPEPTDPPEQGNLTTEVSVSGDSWYINGLIVNPNSAAQGLLMNSRMVQAAFEDENPDTQHYWRYSDGSSFDPERNADEFIAMVPTYASYGLNAVTVSLQGGRPRSGDQVWINTAFRSDGSLKSAYMDRMARVIEALDSNGMVAILTLFYFGQDQNINTESGVIAAVDNTIDWVMQKGYTNVVIEIANEADHPDYYHAILKPDRVHELINRARQRSGGKLLVSVSLRGGQIPSDTLLAASDFHLPHGNGQSASQVANMITKIRSSPGYGGEPITFNEDSTKLDNMRAAVNGSAGWGYYDNSGYQQPPTNWGINTQAKQDFFNLVREMTTPTQESGNGGGTVPPPPPPPPPEPDPEPDPDPEPVPPPSEDYSSLIQLHVNPWHPNANNNNDGTEDYPLATIRAGIDRAHSNRAAGLGTRVLLHPGIYREEVNTVYADVGNALIVIESVNPYEAIMSGSDIWTNWECSSGICSKHWPYKWGVAENPWPNNVEIGELARRREMVFVNGVNMVQKLTHQELVPGSFFVDEAAERIYVSPPTGVNMNSALVEVGVRGQLLRLQNLHHMVIRGMVFQHSSSPFRTAAVDIVNQRNVTFEYSRIVWNSFGGLSLLGHDLTARNIVMNYNGGSGIGATRSTNILIENTETSYNQWRTWLGNFSTWSTGHKLSRIHGLTIRNHKSIDNMARGLWLDSDVKDVILDNIELCNNFRDGVFLEALQGPIIFRNSLICDNNDHGILGGTVEKLTLDNVTIRNNRLEQLRISGTANRPITDYFTVFCKKKGIVFKNSEIYGGLAGIHDYGPLGVELKRNVTDNWWTTFVRSREDMVGIDGATISSSKVWEASGHLASFTDPLVQDLKTKKYIEQII